MTYRRVGAVVVALLAAGCLQIGRVPRRGWEPVELSVSGSSAGPELAYSDAEVAEQLHAAERARRERVRVLSARLEHNGAEGVGGRVRAVEAGVALGAPEVVEDLIAAHPELVAWDEDVVEIRAQFQEGGRLRLDLVRDEAAEDVVVCVPAGTGAVASNDTEPRRSRRGRWVDPAAEQRFGRWPAAQDLALLGAPAIHLAAGQRFACVEVPVACASFEVSAPLHDQPFKLMRFAKGSAIERVLVEVCRGEPRPSEEVQLAVWIARNDLSWGRYLERGGGFGLPATFGGRSVLPSHGRGASALLVQSGVDPRGRAFFGESPPSESQPSEPPAEGSQEGRFEGWPRPAFEGREGSGEPS